MSHGVVGGVHDGLAGRDRGAERGLRQAGAYGEDEVGAAQELEQHLGARAGRGAAGERVGLGQRALARVGRDDRRRHQLGKFRQLRARPGVEHPLPGPEHRVLGRRQHLRRLPQRGRVGRRALRHDGLVVELARQLLLPHLGRDLDQHRAAPAGPHRLEGAAHQLRHFGHGVRAGRPLGDRGVDLRGVEGRVAVLPVQRLAGRQDQHRHVLGIGLGDAGEGVLDAGSGLGREHPVAAAAVDPAVAVRQPDADPLLAAQDRADADLRAGLDQRVARVAGEEPGPLAPEDFRDGLGSVHAVLPVRSIRSGSGGSECSRFTSAARRASTARWLM